MTEAQYTDFSAERNEDDLAAELVVDQEEERKDTIIMVVGVGGAGGNAVNHMWKLGIEGVEFLVCNTDKQALNKSIVERKICLGKDGLGAGNDPVVGRQAAIESLDEVRSCLERSGTRMLFIAAGMGGGTGTGASPVIAKLAHEMGILTVAIVTSPLRGEGPLRMTQAAKGIDELKQHVDSLLVVKNENLSKIYGDLSLIQAFGKADDILASAAKGIAEIITVESPLVNVDFADVKRVMTNSGRAHMGVAIAEGPDRAEKATLEALHSPLLEQDSITGAKHILANIVVSDLNDLKQSEVDTILAVLQEHSAQQADAEYHGANIIWGTSVKKQLGKSLELVVVITGFKEEAETPTVPIPRRKPPVKQDEQDELVPVGKPPVRTQPAEPVVLGKRENAYENIDEVLECPAYKRRHADFVTVVPGTEQRRKETLKEENPPEQKTEKGASLFDTNPNA